VPESGLYEKRVKLLCSWLVQYGIAHVDRRCIRPKTDIDAGEKQWLNLWNWLEHAQTEFIR